MNEEADPTVSAMEGLETVYPLWAAVSGPYLFEAKGMHLV